MRGSQVTGGSTSASEYWSLGMSSCVHVPVPQWACTQRIAYGSPLSPSTIGV